MLLNAQYTMCFVDAYALDPTLFDDMEMSTDERKNALVKMLKSKYNIYEIAGETLQEFKLFLTNKFNQWVFYYEQLLDAYEQEFDWKDGDVEDVDMVYTNDATRVVTPRTQAKTTSTPGVINTREDYDLPRSTSSENRPSSKTVTTPSGQDVTIAGSISGEDTIEDDGTRTEKGKRGRVNLVEQREKYLKAVRNLYMDFAEKFKPCFLDMY